MLYDLGHLIVEATPSLGVTFDDAMERLATFERMYVEPDGSFVWVSADDTRPWQVDGVLYDSPHGLSYVELKGTCPPAAFERLLAAIRNPQAECTFRLVREGLAMSEAEWHMRIGGQQ